MVTVFVVYDVLCNSFRYQIFISVGFDGFVGVRRLGVRMERKENIHLRTPPINFLHRATICQPRSERFLDMFTCARDSASAVIRVTATLLGGEDMCCCCYEEEEDKQTTSE